MKGVEVKKVLTGAGVTQRDLAEKLDTTPQNVNNLLSKEDVRTGFLEDICRVTGLPMSSFYPESIWGYFVNSPSASNQVTNLPESFVQLLAKKDEQIDRLLAIIDKLSK